VIENAGPLLTAAVHEALLAARASGTLTVTCSLDLSRTETVVKVGAAGWAWGERQFPFLNACKDRTVYHWSGSAFEVVARFGTSLTKLVPTEWGAPTFEIDGIKMLPTARVSPYEDAKRKVNLIQPRGKRILDTCGGLGYFAAWCLRGHAARIDSYENNADVIWLRSLNPWSPDSLWSYEPNNALTLTRADIVERISTLPNDSVDAILHDPPRFSIAGELYSQKFYAQLARVLKHKGRLFHYTGAPNKVSRGRDLHSEVATRLRRAGFSTELIGDGLLAVKAIRT
jgi:predicted methyltransferase